jgi:predicted esterase
MDGRWLFRAGRAQRAGVWGRLRPHRDRLRTLSAAACALALSGCSAARTAGDTAVQPAAAPPALSGATAPLPSAAPDSAPAPAASQATGAAPDSPPPPAERFDPSLPAEVKVEGDLVAQVAHGPVGNRRAIVYLHGVCGNVHKFRDWTAAAVHFGTVIAVLGDDKCKEPGRYRWGAGVERTDRRIVAALRAVSAVRGAPLDTDAVTVVGYSQGSARAEALVRAFPSRYRRAILVAGPREHAPSSFREALGVAVVAGQKDLKNHLVESAEKALKAGVRARYFELPGAHHGEYGPDAVRVMGEALSWIYAEHG